MLSPHNKPADALNAPIVEVTISLFVYAKDFFTSFNFDFISRKF
jgi:hypothetical protein